MPVRRTLASRLLCVLAVATCAVSGSVTGCGGDVSGGGNSSGNSGTGGSTSVSSSNGAGGHGACWPDSCTGPSGPSGGTGGGAACNDVAAGGDAIPIDDTTMPPTMTGGTLVDGSYYITSMKVFHAVGSGPFGGGPTQQETYRIAGTTLDTAYTINLGGPEGAAGTTSYDSLVAAGNHISAHMVCGGNEDLDATYTTDGTHLQILWPEDQYGNTWLREFDRQ